MGWAAPRLSSLSMGLASPDPGHAQALRRHLAWRWASLAAQFGTIPAFYLDMLGDRQARWAAPLYAGGALLLALALAHVALAMPRPAEHLRRNWIVLLLIGGLLLCAALPSSLDAPGPLALRLFIAVLTLGHMVWLMRDQFARGSVPHLLVLSLAVLVLCGVGFWWLEPRAHSLGDGLWLAFTTAATVGYGDIVPTTAASKIFAVFVVVLGFGVLSMVTAAIAASWIQSDERRLERDILRLLHRELQGVRQDIASLRATLAAERTQEATAPADATEAEAGPRRSAYPPSRTPGP